MGFVSKEGPVTPEEVSRHFDLGPEGEKKEQWGRSEASTRLRRLVSWNMVHKESRKEKDKGDPDTFIASDYGRQVLLKPDVKGATTEELEGLKEKVEELSGLQEQVQELEGLRERVKELESAPSPLSDYQDAFSLDGGILDGPVTLQRILEVELAKFRTEGVNALPSGRIELAEDDLSVEKKFDGHLVQVVSGRIYSRRGVNYTANFPMLQKSARGFKNMHLVGELTYWHGGRMDESAVTSIAGTKDPNQAIMKQEELPGRFQIILFDIIGHDGDISGSPLSKRRQVLEKIFDDQDGFALSPTYPLDEWSDAFRESLKEGGEGIVVKNLNAPYIWRPLGAAEAKPVGTMWKIKKESTDDFVALNPRMSEKGKLLVTIAQFWKGDLIPIQEIDNFSQETAKEILKLLRSHSAILIEVSFQERFKEPPGKLRGGAFVRIRDDKPLASATLPKEYAE